MGSAPHANDYVYQNADCVQKYPLQIYVCENCWLVQTKDFVKYDDIFSSDYAYFSSTSSSWLKHAENFSNEIINMLKLNENSFVVEIASNDGYLLKNFLKKNIPSLGVEPTLSTEK